MLGSVLALLLPRTVVLGILPAPVELVDLLLALGLYLFIGKKEVKNSEKCYIRTIKLIALITCNEI